MGVLVGAAGKAQVCKQQSFRAIQPHSLENHVSSMAEYDIRELQVHHQPMTLILCHAKRALSLKGSDCSLFKCQDHSQQEPLRSDIHFQVGSPNTLLEKVDIDNIHQCKRFSTILVVSDCFGADSDIEVVAVNRFD